MSWIKTIPYQTADAKLKRIYDRVKGPDNKIDNVLTAHSLRPHTLVGHMTLYKSVLHNKNNELPKWYLEATGIYVSILNRCEYCILHHLEGLRRLFKDDSRLDKFYDAARNDTLEAFLEPKYKGGMDYVKKLTIMPDAVNKADVETLKQLNFTDGELLELNQVGSYFNYVNRTVLGLGISTKGDILGLSPNKTDDPADWQHQ